MKFKKIVAIDISESALSPTIWNQIKELGDSFVAIEAEDPNTAKELQDADCLLVRFNLTKETIALAPNLKYIGALATGTGKIDVEFARSHQIVVTNIPGYSTESVAELVFAMLLERLRDLARAKQQAQEGNHSEVGFKATEIKAKEFGVIGLGHIGGRVAEIAQGFGANVKYWSRNRKPEMESKGMEYLDLAALVSQSDIISINMALKDETTGILNSDLISKIKPGAIIVNTAPHELLDLGALLSRIQKGELIYIFDHSDPGDITEDKLKILHEQPNCDVYPPIGYITEEAKQAKQDILLGNLRKFLSGQPSNVV